jgi:hypothetical protein
VLFASYLGGPLGTFAMKAGKPSDLDLDRIRGVVNGVVNLAVSGWDRRQVLESAPRLVKRLDGGGELIRGRQPKRGRHFRIFRDGHPFGVNDIRW